MKIVNIGRYLINLDKVILIDTETQALKLDDGNEIRLTEEQLEEFVFNYNLYDTEELKFLIKSIGRVVTSNPEFLTKEGIQEKITIMVRWYKQEDYFKEITEGTKLKELSLNKLLLVYKLLQEKVKELEKDLPF